MHVADGAPWPPSLAPDLAVRTDACAAEPTAPLKTWVYEAPSIGFVVSGGFDYLTEESATFAAPGAVIFGNAGERFRVRHHDARGNVRLVMALCRDRFDEVARAQSLAPRFHTAAAPPGALATQIFAWMQILATGRVAVDELEYAIIAAALTARPREDKRRVSAKDKARVREALEHIATHFALPCTLQTLAERTNTSRYQFLRIFTAAVGQTPNQFLINARLRAAADRLGATTAPILTIALDVGFNDISHFYACFRSAFGCTPRQWRLQQRR